MFSLWLVLCLSITWYGAMEQSYGAYAKKKGGIVHPCDVGDINCIRDYFANKFDRIPRNGSVPDPLVRSYGQISIPHVNVSHIPSNNSEITGLSKGEFKEFFINETSGHLILEVLFPEITYNDSSATLRFYRKGREPVDITDYLHYIYRQVSMTLVFPINNGLEISVNTVYSYIGDSNVVHIGPNFSSKDPVIHSALRNMFRKIQTTAKETFAIVGHIFMSVLFENNVNTLLRAIPLVDGRV